MSTFKAKYEGRCAADCGRSIEAGDDVVYVDDELVHEDCEELALVPHEHRLEPGRTDQLERLFGRPLAPVCGVCFLEKPCPCEDGL